MNPYEPSRPAIVPPAPPSTQAAGPNRLARWALPAALAAGAGYALHRAGRVQDEQEARMTDITNARQHDMGATLPLMSVKNAHDEFYQRKLAGAGQGGGGFGYSPVAPRVYDAGAGALANVFADVWVKQPLNSLIGLVKKKLYTEPKQRRVFDELNASGLLATPLDTLSMGMSDDLEAAVAAGSTMVRVGSAIFGSRT